MRRAGDHSRAQQLEEAQCAWQKAEGIFSNRRAMMPSLHWLTGLGSRMGWKRMRNLESTRHARALRQVIDPLSHDQIFYFRQYADVNYLHAQTAIRLFFVVILSVPLGLLFALNQLVPDGLGAIAREIGWLSFFGAVLVGALMLITSSFYAFAGVHQARNLADLMKLALASAQYLESIYTARGQLAEGDATPEKSSGHDNSTQDIDLIMQS